MEVVKPLLIFLIIKFIACQESTDQLIKIRLEIVGPDGLIVTDGKHGILANVKPEIPTTDRLIELFKKCLPGHYLFGRNCYSIKNDIQVLSYDLAQASCNSMEVIGSQPSLVSISSKDELDFVNSLIKTNLNSPASVLIGLKNNPISGYTWTDGSSLNTTNWCTDKPSTESSNECVEIRDSSCFSDSPCVSSIQNQAYICEYELPSFDKRKRANVPRGEMGPKGETGNQGVKGETGQPGEKGERGDQGNQGNNGRDGQNGQKGEKGETPTEFVEILKSKIGLHDTFIENLNTQVASHDTELKSKNELLFKLGETMDTLNKRSELQVANIQYLKEELDKITTNDDQIFKFLASIASLLDAKVKKTQA